jgi:hypothetical protein
VRYVVTFALGVALAAGGFVAYDKLRTGEWRLEPDGDHVHLTPLPAPKRPVMRKIFLDRGGAKLTAGADDSTAGRSSIVAGANRTEVAIPAFRGSDKAWKQIVACVRDQYARFAVEVVEQRPLGRGYIHVVVGGTPSLLGFKKTIGGLAPYSGEPIPDAIVLVFSRALAEKPRAVCETAAMEIAHAYGLDHVYLCKDPMSYLTGCGNKTFQVEAAPCGERKPRVCGDGSATQSSVGRLLEVLGPRRQ